MKKKLQKSDNRAIAKNMPLGVKILAILNYISTVMLVLIGIVLIILTSAVGKVGIDKIQQEYVNSADYQQLLQNDPTVAQTSLTFTLLVLKNLQYIGIILILLGVLCFFLGRGLWKGKNWARIVEAVFAVFGFVVGVAGLVSLNFSAVFNVLINGLIGWYLLFNKNVLRAFNVK